MYYVSWIREYPIFEPAEGGYYYAGEQVFYCKEYPTWKKANRAYQKMKREFSEYAEYESAEYVYEVPCGGVGKIARPKMQLCQKYIGRDEWIQITRRRPVERGRVPYC